MVNSEQELKRLEAHFAERPKKDGRSRAFVLLDGAKLEASQVHVEPVRRLANGQRCEIPSHGDIVTHVMDDGVAETVSACRFDDIGSSLGVVSIAFSVPWNPFLKRVYIVRRSTTVTSWALLLPLKIWGDEWAFPFTMGEYFNALGDAATNDGFELLTPFEFSFICWAPPAESKDISPNDWNLAFLLPIRSSANTVGDEIASLSNRLRRVSDRATRHIMTWRTDALVSFFSFPAPYKAACEQYLLYFVQFLEDLGIDADAEIKQHAGELMFSVMPKDGSSALEKIRAALQIYLRLPVEPALTRIAGDFQDLAVAQLRANVLFLQSQLELSRAVLQAKDAAIESLDLIAFRQRQLLTSGRESINAPLASSKAADEEPLFGDALSITPYQGKGFRVNLPLLLRRLKRVMRPTRD